MSKTEKPKKVKKQGPLRVGAIVPIAIILAGTWAYAYFLLDNHVRYALELGAGAVHGAEVNVAKVVINFREPSLTIRGIEVTDKETPELNAVAIGSMRFALLWDALLRAKVVVSEASIKEIALGSPRKYPGKVYPPPPPPPPSEGPSLTQQVGDQVMNEAKAQLSQNVFGDIVKVLEGSDPKDQLAKLQADLQSEKKIAEVNAALIAKKAEWSKRIDALPQGKEIKAIADKIQSTKINTSNPVEAKKQIDQLRVDLKAADQIVDTYAKGQKDLKADVGGFDQSIKDIEAFIQKDINDLQNKFQLPSIDTDQITKALFVKLMGDKLTTVTKYMDMAKAYLPEKKKGGEAAEKKPEFIPHPRNAGRTYKFPVTVGYPLFWLKHAEISSTATPEGFSGDFQGILADVTTDPRFINKPTTFTFSGSAERQKILGVKLDFVMDYRGEEGFSELNLNVAGHPFPEQAFAKQPDITFVLSEATASAAVTAKFQGDTIDAKVKETVTPPKFVTDAKSPILKEALETVTKRIKTLTMEASLTGRYSSPKLGLQSNLGYELGVGLKQHLSAKIAAARAQLKAFVDGKVGAEKAKLMAEYTKQKEAMTNLLGSKQKEIDSYRADAEKMLKEKSKLPSPPTDEVKEKAKEKAKDALKKLKF